VLWTSVDFMAAQQQVTSNHRKEQILYPRLPAEYIFTYSYFAHKPGRRPPWRCHKRIDCPKGYDGEWADAKAKNVLTCVDVFHRNVWSIELHGRLSESSSDLHQREIIYQQSTPAIVRLYWMSDILLEKESLVLCSVPLACFALRNGLVQVTTEERSVA
jgi:hypothetical protein